MAKELSEEELQELRETFDHYDRDKSGAIDVVELSSLIEALGMDISDEELEVAMMSLDADESGVIELDEFVDWWSGR
ncbi:MAG: EF-hand domain-containing protein [Alphaproteobacteria bacterium]|nr:EF-hand domain-containing protein [Alphaproteobacteria bacterium]MCB9796648.1 EF-hand domain-containing protein [Alphaproteobacteria bacterium]